MPMLPGLQYDRSDFVLAFAIVAAIIAAAGFALAGLVWLGVRL